MKLKKYIPIIFLILILPSVNAISGSSNNYQLNYGILGYGRGNGSSSTYNVSYAMYEQPVADSNSTNYRVYLGHYWQLNNPPVFTEVFITATVESYCGQTLSGNYNNITFGNIFHGTIDNNATGNGDGSVKHSDFYTTTFSNTNCNITWSAIDFTYDANTIKKGNFSMSYAEDPAFPNPLGNGSTSFLNDIKLGNLDTGSKIYSNFFLDIPVNQSAGKYQSILILTIQKS